jgi:integrase
MVPAARLPACPATIAGFVDAQTAAHRISTIKRRVAAITFAHRMSDLPNPSDHSTVRLALRRSSRAKPRRPEQVRGLTHYMLMKILAMPPATLNELRDAALISVGYDTLCRSSEIAAMQVEYIRRGANDTASILIPRSKADCAGNGRIAHFSPATVECLAQWLEAAGIDEGPLFQALHLGHPSGQPLQTCSTTCKTGRPKRGPAETNRRPTFRPLDARRRHAGHDGDGFRHARHYAGWWVDNATCRVSIRRECVDQKPA